MVLTVKNFQLRLKQLTWIALLLLFSGMAFTVFGQPGRADCKLGALPSVPFASKSAKLSMRAMTLLDAASETMKQNPGCKVKVTGFGASDKSTQQLSWDHVNAVIKYLAEKRGISNDRFIFEYGLDGGSPTSVDMQATTEDGPHMVPAPHPVYSTSSQKGRK